MRWRLEKAKHQQRQAKRNLKKARMPQKSPKNRPRHLQGNLQTVQQHLWMKPQKQQRAQRQQKTARMQQRYQKRMLRPARMLRRQARLRQPEVQGMRSSLRRMQPDSQRKRNPLPMAGPEPERVKTLTMQKNIISRRKQHQNAFQERFTTWGQWHLPIFLTFLLQKQVICTTFPMNLLQIALLKMGLALQYLLGLTCIKPLMVIGMCCLEFVRFVIMPTFLKATQQKMKILRGLYGISRQRLLSADPLPMPMLYFW